MAVLLNCQSISKSFGIRDLFQNLTFGMDENERLGLIGPNGTGKSTLLKILAGLEQPDDGALNIRRALRAGYVPQEEIFEPEDTPWSVLSAALEDQHLDEREVSNRVNAMLGRVGFSQTDRDAALPTLSGGWRKRVSIARELIREPNLLLMDEPTNHLDLEGIMWLERLLSSARFACLLVSHDRWFLEKTCNRVMELNRCYPEGFFSSAGAYSDFLQKRDDFLKAQKETQRALEGVVKREIEWLRKGPPGRTTKSRARIDEAGRLINDLAQTKMRNSQGIKVTIDFNSSDRQANKLITIKGVSKSLGGKKLIEGLNLILSPGMKLGLLGRNGSGKTTFLKLLTGELKPDTGSIEQADRLRIVYFDQSRAQLDKSLTLRRALTPTSGDMIMFRDQPIHVIGWAKRFLFKPEQLDMPVASLSGGEQARILIARLMLQPADILLLDEPTNDLDIPSLEVLEESLSEFPGAIVLVTHDRYMLTRLSSQLLSFDGDGVVNDYTDYDQWERARDAGLAEENSRRDDNRKSSARDSRNDGAGSSRKDKKLSYKEQVEFEQMEAQIQQAEKSVEACQVQLEIPEVADDPVRLLAVCQDLADEQAKVDALYARWQELEEKQK